MNELLLLSGNDIPFPEAQLTIHPPKLKEIAYIGEEAFFLGCGFLNFSKNLLSQKDKTNLDNLDDFDIFMTIMINKKKEIKQSIDSALLVLALLFPLYSIEVRKDAIVLKKEDEERIINRKNFSAFKNILSSIFCLNLGGTEDKYNPSGDLAEKIAKKLKKGQEKISQLKHELKKGKFNVLSRYASILAVGLQKNLNELMQYTVYQLYDELQRFQLKLQWDSYVQARMAGAKDLEEVDNWMIDLKEQGQNKNKNKK